MIIQIKEEYKEYIEYNLFNWKVKKNTPQTIKSDIIKVIETINKKQI